ncbi:hypothetical protein WJX73_009013 [Symbiochloris irregularis]|uniref:Uncharacterized protein n=1 Tax=Symbiochloris irregularis TaxID=706552 RepID=A0AAW1PN17_9CHLO
MPKQPPTLDSLAAQFVASLDTQHPSASSTILRTACKLQAFSFNTPAEQQSAVEFLPPQQSESEAPLCRICSSPISSRHMQAQGGDSSSRCCSSCEKQVLPPTKGATDKISRSQQLEALLPSVMQTQ